MAATGHDVSDQDLNLVFKRLGERGREAELFQEYNENIPRFYLEQLTKYLSNTTENKITVRLYGSVAEDLKCLSPNDYGDTDIMVFPSSESLMVHEDMLEYSSENPLYVRIKGGDHPVLQSYLVEGTENVATSALKNFHPAIYGSSSPQLIEYLTYSLGISSRDDRAPSQEFVTSWRNKKTSPALTIDAEQSFETTQDTLQEITESQRLHSFESPEWEWLANTFFMAREVEYTREHAVVMNEFLQYAKEFQASLTNDGPDSIIQGFPTFFQEMLFSDKMQHFISRMQAIESRSQNESGSPEEDTCHDDLSVTQEKCDAREGGSSTQPSDSGPCVTPQNFDDAQTPKNQDLEFFHSMETTRPSDEPVTKQLNERKNADDTTEDTTTTDRKGNIEDNSQTDLKTTTEKKLIRKDGTLNEAGMTDAEINFQQYFDHMFVSETEIKQVSEKGKEYQRKIGIDLVPALRFRGWPKAARDWLKRNRKWPSADMVDKVIQEGCHLVVKPSKNSENPDCEFRVSFSHAEYLLSKEMNEIQRECYRCLKKVHRAHLSSPPGLVTFHLKTLLLETIEETGVEKWTESNRAECMMKLLGKLSEALRKKHLSHFFVISYNMFGVDYIENPENLASLAEKVEKIMESPMEFSKHLILQNQEEEQIEKEESEPDSEAAVSATSVSQYGQEGEAEPRGDRDNQRSKQTLERAVSDSNQLSSSLFPNYRYHDLQDMYFQVGNELVEKASSGDEILDPLERSLVEDLREMIRNHNLQAKNFRTMFECYWKLAYFRICLSTEPDMRRRMLDVIHGDVQTWKYLLKQEDLAEGNEVALANRMLDPSAEDRFDLNHLIPVGEAGQMIRMFVNGLTQRPAQPGHAQAVHDEDDIPLD